MVSRFLAGMSVVSVLLVGAPSAAFAETVIEHNS